MGVIKSFIADAATERSLVLTYLRFPEVTEVFLNIANSKSLSENVLSEWDHETLELQMKEFVVPKLLDAGAIRKDASKPSGYATDFSDIAFTGLSDRQLASIAAKRALAISESFCENDTRQNAMSANLYFGNLTETQRSELLGSLRNMLNKYLTDIPGTNTDGKAFRLAIIARSEK